MQNKKLSVLFYINKAKSNGRGLAPLICRITFNKKRKEFSTGYYINPNDWDSNSQLIIAKSPQLKSINTQLNMTCQHFLQVFNTLLLQEQSFDVDDIFNMYKGNSKKPVVYVLEFYNDYLERINKLVGIEIEIGTWKKYENSLKNLNYFISDRLKVKDIKIETVDLLFVKEFEYYLKTVKKFAQVTINKILQRFKKVLTFAEEQNLIDKNPFLGYRFNIQKKEVILSHL